MTDAMTNPAMTGQTGKYQKLHTVMGVLAVVFGLLTLKEGSSAIWARQSAGDIVYFVLYFNFSAGFLYLFTGADLLMKKPWVIRPATLLAVSSFIVLGLLGIHIALDQPYATRTLVAMTFRTVFWAAFALTLFFRPVSREAHSG
jgi:hypothetical protein